MKKLAIFVVLLSSFASAQTQIASDTFTYSNGGLVSVSGGNWANSGGFDGFNVSSNVLVPISSQQYANIWSGAGTFVNDQYSQAVINSGASTRFVGVAVRGTAGGSKNYYYFVCSSTQCKAGKFVNGTETAIQTAVNHSTTINGKTLRAEIVGTTLTFKINGATPANFSAAYTDSSFSTGKPGVVNMSGSATGTNVDTWAGGNQSAALPVVADPTYSPVAGVFTSPQSVTITSTTPGATICYTTNGSNPAATNGTCIAGSTYSGAVSLGTQHVNETITLKAIGSKSGYDNSAVVSGNYVFQYAATTTTTFPTGTYIGRVFPQLSCATSGSSIYYTTDGSTPTTGSTLYTNVTTPTGVTAVKSGTGGTLIDQEFRYRVTALTANGETLVSSEGIAANLTGTGTNSVTVSWSAVSGATGYKIYGRSPTDTTKGLLATVGAVTSWVDTGANTPATKTWLENNKAGFPVYDTTGIPSATSGTQTIKAICTKAGFGDGPVLTSTYTINPSDVELVYDNFDSYDTSVFRSGSYQIGLPVDQWWTNNNWMHISQKTGNVGALQFKVITILTQDMCFREGHQCIGTGNGGDGVNSAAANIAASYSADQWASIKVWDAEHHDGGVCLRCNTDGNTAETGYKITAYTTQIGQENELGGRVTVSKVVNGSETVLCKNQDLYTSFGYGVYWGATLKARIAGNTLEATINGEPIPGCPAVFVDSSSPITQGNPGFWSYGAYNSASMLTEFRAGNVGSTPVANSTPLIPNWSYQTYSAASVGGSWPWVPAATQQEVHYRAPFQPNGQFQKSTIGVNTFDSNLDKWAIEIKQESWIPGSRDGGCTAAGNTSCTNSVGYFVGVRPYNASIASNGVPSTCTYNNGQYACRPFAHITKTTPVAASTNPADVGDPTKNYCGGSYNPVTNPTGCNNIVTLASSTVTPMQGDEWYAEYLSGSIRVACKRSQSYGSWQATHAYSLNNIIVDGNGNFQRVVVAGTSAGSPPTFATTWAVSQGNRVTDGGVTWEYYGQPCPSSTAFTWVLQATDSDLLGRVSYPALSANGSTFAGTFSDWSAGSATASTACDTLELCADPGVHPVVDIAETSTPGESVGATVKVIEAKADAVTVGDTLAVRSPIRFNLPETASIADALVAARVSAPQTKALADAMATAESGNATTINGSGLSGDSTTVGDSLVASKISGTQSYFRSAAETVSASDTLARSATHPRSITESASLGDGLNVSSSGKVSQNENTILADSVAVKATHNNVLADSAAVGDVIAVYVTHPSSLKKKVVVIS